MRRLYILLLLTALPVLTHARAKVQGWCEQGNKTILVQGFTSDSSTPVQRSYPSCTVNVYIAGTVTSASIYADDSGTPKANPFTADSSGYWFFYADDGKYDVRLSGGGIPSPTTMGDHRPFDPYYKSSAGGAVPRLYLSKVGEVVSPKDHGAVCDGVTDDTSAIQSAVDATALNGVLHISGTCKTTNKITINKGIHISGESRSCSLRRTIIKAGTGPAIVLALTTGEFASFSDLCIDGDSTAGGIGIFLGGDKNNIYSPSTAYGARNHFERVTVQEFETGIQYGNNAFGNTYHDVDVINNGTGVDSSYGISNLGQTERWIGGWFYGNTVYGYNVTNNDVEMYGTHFEYNATGVYSAFGTFTGYKIHFESISEAFLAPTGGPAVDTPNAGGSATFTCYDCNFSYNNSTGTNSELIRVRSNDMNMRLFSPTFTSGGNTITQAINMSVVTPDSSRLLIHNPRKAGSVANILAYYTSNVTPIFTYYDSQGRFYYNTETPTNSSMIQANPGNAQFAPAPFYAQPSTHATSRRTGIGFGDWFYLQDSTGSGTKDMYLFNSTLNDYPMFQAADGRVCYGRSCTILDSDSTLTIHKASAVTKLSVNATSNGTSPFLSAAVTSGTVSFYAGSGSPEGVVTAVAGSIYLNTAGGAATTLYVKQSGSGNTGWVGK